METKQSEMMRDTSFVGDLGNNTKDYVSLEVAHGLSHGWQNTSLDLSDWQISRLEEIGDSIPGLRCVLNSWLIREKDFIEEKYCETSWDNFNCWPPAKSNSKVEISCAEAFKDAYPDFAPHLNGFARRHCLENASWLWGDWTNYTECAESYEEVINNFEEEAEKKNLLDNARLILFSGSILSVIFLLIAISIFLHFRRCLWCDRVTIHTHLMTALLLRHSLLVVITAPFIFDAVTNYRSGDILCKAVLTVYLYSIATSVNWMFIQGAYINRKLTTHVFQRDAPFKFYYFFGWALPVFFLFVYVLVMEWNEPEQCYDGYGNTWEIWIIYGPMIAALIVNFLFLLNILRVLVTKAYVNRANRSSDCLHYWRTAKATLFLLPLLGITNLVFVYNPGGIYHKSYVLLNSFFGSTQGIFVAVVYCYMSKDVQDAFHRSYFRYITRREAYSSSRDSGIPRCCNISRTAGSSRVVIHYSPASSRVTTTFCHSQPLRESRSTRHNVNGSNDDS